MPLTSRGWNASSLRRPGIPPKGPAASCRTLTLAASISTTSRRCLANSSSFVWRTSCPPATQNGREKEANSRPPPDSAPAVQNATNPTQAAVNDAVMAPSAVRPWGSMATFRPPERVSDTATLGWIRRAFLLLRRARRLPWRSLPSNESSRRASAAVRRSVGRGWRKPYTTADMRGERGTRPTKSTPSPPRSRGNSFGARPLAR